MDTPIPNWLQQRLIFEDNKETRQNAVEELYKLTYPNEKCGDCNQEVQSSPRVVDYQRKFIGSKSGWTAKCRVCKMSRNPLTGKFDVSKGQSNSLMRKAIKASDK